MTDVLEPCPNSGRPAIECRCVDHWCDRSDLHVTQCALACHRNEHLPAGLEPDEEPVRGVLPSGQPVWPPPKDVARLQQVAAVTTVDRLGRRSSTLLATHRYKRAKDTGNCRYVAELGSWCTPQHGRDCTSNLCQGCQPCEKDHCAMRGACPNHVNHTVGLWTCPQCINRVRVAIAEIVDDGVWVSAEMEYADLDAEPANLAGRAVDPEQLAARRASIITSDQARGWCDYPMRIEIYGHLDQHHPFAVLTRWEAYFRDAAGVPETTWFPTLSRAAAYLTGLLNTRMPHTEAFEQFSRDVLRCLSHIRDVLSDSRRPELGAPCPRCAEAVRGTGRRAQPLVRRRDEADRTGANDQWVCHDVPTHRWYEAEYKLRVAGDYLAHADRLTADHMRKQYGITPGNLRKWAERNQVRKRGRDSNGRLMYDVRDARQCEDRRRGWCDWPRLTDVYPIEREQVTA